MWLFLNGKEDSIKLTLGNQPQNLKIECFAQKYTVRNNTEKKELMILDNNSKCFIDLLQAGLWEHDVKLSQYQNIYFNVIYRLAEEQSVLGPVVAGFDHVDDVKVPQKVSLTFIGGTLQLEQQ